MKAELQLCREAVPDVVICSSSSAGTLFLSPLSNSKEGKRGSRPLHHTLLSPQFFSTSPQSPSSLRQSPCPFLHFYQFSTSPSFCLPLHPLSRFLTWSPFSPTTRPNTTLALPFSTYNNTTSLPSTLLSHHQPLTNFTVYYITLF